MFEIQKWNYQICNYKWITWSLLGTDHCIFSLENEICTNLFFGDLLITTSMKTQTLLLFVFSCDNLKS